jgi:hypothetical protein
MRLLNPRKYRKRKSRRIRLITFRILISRGRRRALLNIIRSILREGIRLLRIGVRVIGIL